MAHPNLPREGEGENGEWSLKNGMPHPNLPPEGEGG
jgi:hypothetical protein